MRFSKIELGQLGICILVVGFCFSFGRFFDSEGQPFTTNLMNFFVSMLVSIVAVGFGFLFHEVAHKLTAQRYGCWAEFRIWKAGLIIAVATSVLSFGSFIFLAPGAVHTVSSRKLSIKEEGHISCAGPLTNLVLGVLFYILYALHGSWGQVGDFRWHLEILGLTLNSYPDNIFKLIGEFGFKVNWWLAAFNLIPFGPLDGVNIFNWNKIVWSILVVLAWGFLLLAAFGVFTL
ncbi:MAG: site-2 protease family protein [Dehalococcoidia bacterium]